MRGSRREAESQDGWEGRDWGGWSRIGIDERGAEVERVCVRVLVRALAEPGRRETRDRKSRHRNRQRIEYGRVEVRQSEV